MRASSGTDAEETGNEESRTLLERIHERPWPVHSPTLLAVGIAGAVARVINDAGQAMLLTTAWRRLPGQIWVTLDSSLALDAAQLAARHRLNGSGAVSTADARRHGTTLITRDRDQLDRLPPVVDTVTPAEALVRLDELEAGGERGPESSAPPS